MSKSKTKHMFTRVKIDSTGSNPFDPPGPGWVYDSFKLSPAFHFCERDDYMALEAVVLWTKKA